MWGGGGGGGGNSVIINLPLSEKGSFPKEKNYLPMGATDQMPQDPAPEQVLHCLR